MYRNRILENEGSTILLACAITLVVVVVAAPPLPAQMTGGQIEAEVMRLLSKDDVRGETGDLTTSPAVLFWYSSLKPTFDQSLTDVQEARRRADKYLRHTPRSHAQWGEYISSLGEMQVAREKYQTAVRNVIAGRRPVLENLLQGGIIKAAAKDFADLTDQQSLELAAFNQVQEQILRQEATIRRGVMPKISWPSGVSGEWREEVEAAIRAATEKRSLKSGAWKRLEKRLSRLRRDLEAAADELRDAAESSWEQLSDVEKKAVAELNVLVEAQIDLASNAMLQQTTIRRVFMAQRTYDVWKTMN